MACTLVPLQAVVLGVALVPFGLFRVGVELFHTYFARWSVVKVILCMSGLHSCLAVLWALFSASIP